MSGTQVDGLRGALKDVEARMRPSAMSQLQLMGRALAIVLLMMEILYHLLLLYYLNS